MATDFDATQLAEMQAASAALHVHAGDISKEDDVAALFARARDAMGGCNVLINNAGILRDRALVKKDKTTGECCLWSRVGKGRARVGEGGV
jgi:3-oxoacyl-[acyl-carrier protein] reductase